ncbi:ankyrin repeat domain-containing protein [Pokkaliibacter sp. CJK22405]|uniref:ankyrin repeat domain-containing protein n=1 Tax=Pokkaliibacter sp. CJK22405 TaxID=3384615 RepID=UPI0039850C48
MKKLVGGLVLALVIVLPCAWAYGLGSMDTETLAQCSVNQTSASKEGGGSALYPASVCFSYLRSFRSTPADIQLLTDGGGLDSILNGDSPMKYKVAAFLIRQGLSVESINHHSVEDRTLAVTPLQAAIYYNDLPRVRFLLDQGANPLVTDEDGHTPLQVATGFQQTRPDVTRLRIMYLLKDAEDKAKAPAS